MSTKLDLTNKNFIPGASSWVAHSYITALMKFFTLNLISIDSEPSIKFQQFTMGDALNLYENLVLKSKWDVRENNNSPSLVLARNHMFCEKITDEENLINSKYLSNFVDNTITEINWDNPLIFLKQIVNLQSKADLIENFEERDNVEREKLFDLLNRINLRKFSETHFAISGYNLIGYNIETDNKVPATAVAENDDVNSRSVTILTNSAVKYLEREDVTSFSVDKTYSAPIQQVDVKDKTKNFKRGGEFLASQLIKDLEYMHQGKIYITFEEDVEIGDKVVLVDNLTNTYGVFEIDAFEHTFDERGMITCLLVKTCLDFVDPFLDYYNILINYKLIQNMKNQVAKVSEVGINANVKTKNIFGIYTKMMVQIPKYASLRQTNDKWYNYHTDENGSKEGAGMYTPLSIRYLPFIKKGKNMMPSCVDYAFFTKFDDEVSFFAEHIARISEAFQNFTEETLSQLTSLGIFILDTLAGMISLGISDLLKPILGLTMASAQKSVTDEKALKMFDTYQDLKYPISYNPYEGVYNLNKDKKYDFIVGFFNVQAQKPENLFGVKNPKYDYVDFLRNVDIKSSTINKMMREAFDTTLLVEMYDSFKYSEYQLEDFENSLKSGKVPHVFKNKLFSNSFGTEYGYSFSNNKMKQFIISQKPVPLTNNRNAIELALHIGSFGYGPSEFNRIRVLKLVWFHNIYGESKGVSENVFKERQDNLDVLIEKYEEELSMQGGNLAVAILADFNMNVIDYGQTPTRTAASETNNIYILKSNSRFTSTIKYPTTLNKKGELDGNCYDNILISKNLKDYVHCQRFIYPMTEDLDKLIVSDHIPVFLAFKNQKGED